MAGLAFWFSARQSACGKPIYKSTQNGGIVADYKGICARILITAEDTCCYHGAVTEMEFNFGLIDDAGRTVSRSYGTLWIEPNAAGAVASGGK